LALLLGFTIWCFRPVSVSIPWENVKVEILNTKNPESKGYEANIIGVNDWSGEKLSLEDFSKTNGWSNSKGLVTGVNGAEDLTIPGHLRDRGEVIIEFKATEKGGFVKVKTGYKETVVDLYASSDNVIAVNIGKDFVNPLYLFTLYICDIISISLICLAILIFAYWFSERLDGESELPDKIMVLSAYLYLAVPLVLFSIGWLKPIFAIVFTAVIGFGLWKVSKDFEYQIEVKRDFLKFFLISLLIAAVWVYFSGIGGYTFQNSDFEARNTIFHDLINHNWPVKYDYRQVPELQNTFGETAALVYYFPYWLPAALVGKAFGWLPANNMLYLWTVLGVTICFHLVARYTKIRKSWVLVLFVLWSGMDIFGQAAIHALTQKPPYLSVFDLLQKQQLEWWAEPGKLFQYSSHTTQLFWVFNQALPAWMVTLLVLNQKKYEGIIFTSTLIFLFAPIPAIGLAPFVAYKIFEKIPFESLKMVIPQVMRRIREITTIQNIVSGGVLFVTALLFFSANVSGSSQQGFASNQHGFTWELLPQSISTGQFIYIYILFCLVEFVPLVILAWNSDNRALLIITFGILLLLPLYKYGVNNDFAMRSSIPALLCLYLLFIKKINTHFLSPDTFQKGIYSAIILFVLLFSAVTPLHEILRSRDMVESGFPSFADSWKTFDKLRNEPGKKISATYFLISDPAEKLFFKTIGK
jgi:hypothetical protein